MRAVAFAHVCHQASQLWSLCHFGRVAVQNQVGGFNQFARQGAGTEVKQIFTAATGSWQADRKSLLPLALLKRYP
jgi:hypothetical protein